MEFCNIDPSYTLLDREAFAKIIGAHLNRRRSPDHVFKAE
jgi:hypothetical protein